MWRWYVLLSLRPEADIAALRREVEAGRNPKDAKVALAREITARFHGAAAADAAEADFERRARGGVPDEVPEVALAGAPLAIGALLRQAGLAPSASEALRLVEQGGVRVDGETVADRGLKLPAGSYVVQVGKRQLRAHHAGVTASQSRPPARRRRAARACRERAACRPAASSGSRSAWRCFTIALKTAAWHVTGSVGLLSDAMESVVNLAGAAFALWMVTDRAAPARRRPSVRPPQGRVLLQRLRGRADLRRRARHRLGGGRALPRAAAARRPRARHRAVGGSPRRPTARWPSTCCARRASTARWRSRATPATCSPTCGPRSASSPACSAVAATGWLWLDPLVAVAVALNVLREGYALVRRSMLGLMDSSLEPEVMREVDAVLDAFRRPPVRFDHVSSRRAGRRRFVDLHLHIPAHWTLGRAAALRSEVERALLGSVPGLRVTIQLLPLDVEAQHVDELAPDDGGALPS